MRKRSCAQVNLTKAAAWANLPPACDEIGHASEILDRTIHHTEIMLGTHVRSPAGEPADFERVFGDECDERIDGVVIPVDEVLVAVTGADAFLPRADESLLTDQRLVAMEFVENAIVVDREKRSGTVEILDRAECCE